jgi:hypothetical protein
MTKTATIATTGDNDWLAVLQAQIEAPGKSMRIIAEELGYSHSVISQVLKGTYTGDVNKVRAKVEGAYMGAMVHCPGYGGDIPRNRCIEQQGRPFAATNPSRVRLYHTCPTCPNSTKTKEQAI